MTFPRPLADRFAEKVDLNGPIPEHRPDLGPCHDWTGCTTSDGYGSIRVDGDMVGAHRVSRACIRLIAKGETWPGVGEPGATP